MFSNAAMFVVSAHTAYVVEAGDWLVNDGPDHISVYDDETFKETYEQVEEA